MNRATPFFLVLLRLVIGWHLLFAGLEKFEPEDRGSEGYLREATGPLAPVFHWMAGDSLADSFAVQPLPAQQDPAQVPAHERFPLALKAKWEAWFEHFAGHHGLTPQQRELAQQKLKQEMAGTVKWMTQGKKDVVLRPPAGTEISVAQSVSERVEAYQKKLAEVRRLQQNQYRFAPERWFTAPPLENRELALARAELNQLRGGLQRDLAERTENMQEALRDVLTEEQAARGPLPGKVTPGWMQMSRIDWINFLVRWGLTITGACLLLGLFTRTAAVGGALLLLSFTLAMPPLPGLPAVVQAEGYPFINKNLVEAVALLLLATTVTGRWVGLDAILHYFNPWRPGVQTQPASNR